MSVPVRGTIRLVKGQITEKIAAEIGERLIALEKAMQGNSPAIPVSSPAAPAFGGGAPGAPGSPGAPGTPGATDHGALTGLDDDDHPQYVEQLEPAVPRPHVHGPDDVLLLDQRFYRRGEAAQPAPHSHHHSTLAGREAVDHPLYHRKHGFELATDGSALVTITYSAGDRKITVTPTGTSFRFWIDGVEFRKYGAQVSGAHTTATGKHFFYYDATGALQVSTSPWSIIDRTVTPVALVYWNNTLADGWAFYECHTADRTLEQHYHDHFSQGTRFISGGALTGYLTGAAGESNAGVTMAIATATVADEDIVRALTAVADGGPYMTLWRSGAAGDWTFNDARVLPYEYDGGANYISYNNQNAGGAGVWGLTSIGAGNFVPYFLCCTTGIQSARQFFLVPAQAVTGTLASALLYTITNIAWGSVPFEEFVPLYRIIFRSGASYASDGRARIEQIDSITSSTTATLPGTPTLHNSLSGRDAADAHPADSITDLVLAARIFGG